MVPVAVFPNLDQAVSCVPQWSNFLPSPFLPRRCLLQAIRHNSEMHMSSLALCFSHCVHSTEFSDILPSFHAEITHERDKTIDTKETLCINKSLSSQKPTASPRFTLQGLRL